MVNWIKTDEFITYPDALERMEQIVSGLISGDETEHIWLLEHPELYTAGTSANSSDLVDPDLFPVYTSQRGGQYTYHGPGATHCVCDVGFKQAWQGRAKVC
jgi:lipoyl(octanoyl) transferase